MPYIASSEANNSPDLTWLSYICLPILPATSPAVCEKLANASNVSLDLNVT